jgi:AhpC/TSA family
MALTPSTMLPLGTTAPDFKLPDTNGKPVSLSDFKNAPALLVLRLDYFRAVADEVVDGEMEILAAGGWKNFPDGTQAYTVHSRAAANLPAGHFELIKTGNHLRLEWTPDKRRGIGAVVREVTIK